MMHFKPEQMDLAGIRGELYALMASPDPRISTPEQAVIQNWLLADITHSLRCIADKQPF